MKLRDMLLASVALVAAGSVGCAVCDTCDDFPAPCTGPNCGQNGLPAYMMNGIGQGPAVMGSATPASAPMDDAAGPAPTMPPAGPAMAAPATPAVDPTTPPAAMELAPR